MSFGFGVGDFIAVFGVANKVRKRIVDAPKDFKVLDAEVRTLAITLQDVDVWLHTASEKQMKSASIVLTECGKLLYELQLFLEESSGLQVPQRAGDKEGLGHKLKGWRTKAAWDSEAIKSFQARMVSSITKLNNIGQQRIQADIDGLVAHKEYQQRSELVEWITPHDYATQQRDVLSKRVDQSASRWLLESEQFAVWLKDPGKTLFCPGIPGAGKTMTTAIVVDQLLSRHESHSLTAFLYCSYRSLEEQSHNQLIASLLRSLVQQLSRPPDLLQHLFETQGRLGTPLKTQEIYAAVKIISASVERVNVLIDALDELPRETRDDIIATMLKLQTEAGLSLFLTSRHNAGIEEKIHPDAALTIEIRAAPEDVEKYLRANQSRLPRCVSGKDDIQELIFRSIAEVVDGMFLLAELHLESLKNKTSVKEIRTALSKLSSGSNAITEAYNEACHRIDSQPEDHKNIAKQTIAILVTARRPLSAVELCHALSVDLETEQVDDEEDLRDIEDILATCAGLVTVDQGSNTVRLVHMSTRDYFHRNRAEFFPGAEHILGKRCVIYRRAKGSDPGQAPFYDYADKNWWSHLTHATKHQELAGSHLNREDKLTRPLAQSKLAEELSIQLGIKMFGSDPALHATMLQACERGNQSLLESLLDITHFDLTRNSDLIAMAVASGHEDIVKTLLSRGADPNSRDINDNPIIFKAIALDSSAIVQMILDAKGDVECRDTFHNFTPLLKAVAEGKLSCLKLLLKVGNSAATDNKGLCVMATAVASGKFEVVKVLLECPEVDVLQCDSRGKSALWWAVSCSKHAMITALLENPRIKDSVRCGVNEKILHKAVELQGLWKGLDTVRFLLGCDAVIQNCCRLIDGWSPLHCAVRQNKYLAGFKRYERIYGGIILTCWKVLKLLLESGLFDVNAADDNGMTPLHHVCTVSTTEPLYPMIPESYLPPEYVLAVMGNMLLSLCSAPGINLDAVDHSGETAMQKALKAGNTVHVKLLVEMGAPISLNGVEQIVRMEERCLKDSERFIDPDILKPRPLLETWREGVIHK